MKDEVEHELEKERVVIMEVEKLLQQVLDQTEQQLRKLRSALYFLDKDLHDKQDNLRIDRSNMMARETSSDLKLPKSLSWFEYPWVPKNI